MTLLWLLVPVLLFGPWLAVMIAYLSLGGRIDALARKLRLLESETLPDSSRRQLEELGRRIGVLEGEGGIATDEARSAEPTVAPRSRPDRGEAAAVAPPGAVLEAPIAPRAVPGPAEAPAPPQAAASMSTAHEPSAATEAPAVVVPAKPKRSVAEVEALIGGNWLNKMGVLVLVMGLALTLGYSFTHMGPGGRVAIGLAVSAGLLAAGRVLERREGYRAYGSGLIGGGWAALYATTYAMHGLEAARVITNPVVGFVMLLAVALGMIVSSLRYRSETVTGIAFVVGFATLAVSPNSSFGILASLPLAAGLLLLAHRLEWVRLAFVGVLATYGVYMFVPGEAPDTGWRLGDFFAGQMVLSLYWLLFEAFDLLRPAHRDTGSGASSPSTGPTALVLGDAIFPLNATAFLGVSVLQWMSVDASMLDLFLPMAGLVFLGDALTRSRVRPLAGARSLDSVPGLLTGYQGAALLSVALGVLSIFVRFTEHSVSIALLLEAQVVFVCGLYLHRRFLRGLAAVVFVIAWSNVVGDLSLGASTTAWFGMQAGSLLAVAGASVLYLNRGWLRTPRASTALTMERAYSFMATMLLVLAILMEAPAHFLEMWWLTLAVVLLEVGLRTRLAELRLQAYAVSGLAFSALMISRVFGSLDARSAGIAAFDSGAAEFAVATGAVVVLLMAVRMHRAAAGDPRSKERVAARAGFVAAGTVLTMSFLWLVLPAPAVVLAWGALALLLIESGAVGGDGSFRLLGNAVMLATCGRLFWTNLWLDGTTGGLPESTLTVLPVIALAYYVAARIATTRSSEPAGLWEGRAVRAYLWIAFLALPALVWLEVSALWVGPAWAVYFVLLFVAGRSWSSDDLRVQAYLLVLPTLAVCQRLNAPVLTASELFGQADHSAVTHAAAVGVVAIAFYLARVLVRFEAGGQAGADGDRDAEPTKMIVLLATLLVSLTLVHEVAGSLLTVALGTQGAVLMAIGFTLTDRVFRLSGLVLLGACVLKAFAYDLSELDPLFRILSFVVLGLLMLGVSFIYTRYREKLQRFL